MAASNTVITADTLSFDYNRMIAVFEGNVVAVDPEVRIDCDRLTVIFDGSNQVKSVTAIGNVRVKQGEKRATCDQAIYVARIGEIELRGNAHLYRGKDEISGNKITFWLDEERMLCEPGRLVIFPGSRDAGGDLLPVPGGGKPRDDRDVGARSEREGE
jgi:lipopolysaccharide export system protein LptA